MTDLDKEFNRARGTSIFSFAAMSCSFATICSPFATMSCSFATIFCFFATISCTFTTISYMFATICSPFIATLPRSLLAPSPFPLPSEFRGLSTAYDICLAIVSSLQLDHSSFNLKLS